jgi:hypothetical protein
MFRPDMPVPDLSAAISYLQRIHNEAIACRPRDWLLFHRNRPTNSDPTLAHLAVATGISNRPRSERGDRGPKSFHLTLSTRSVETPFLRFGAQEDPQGVRPRCWQSSSRSGPISR